MTRAHLLLPVCSALLPACGGPAATATQPAVVVPSPEPEPHSSAGRESRGCTPQPRPERPLLPVAEVAASTDDPLRGRFSLREAVAGLDGQFPLGATIETSEGTLECELWEDVAPRAVASFVGLARGRRPFKDPTTSRWVERPAYDGSTFHRVIQGFMIQGGDPSGTGMGEPGFVLPDEIDESVHASRPGLLYMANRGPNTNGMQFFILDGAAPHLDGKYTAFGDCEPTDVIRRIANVRTDSRDRPIAPVTIERVVVAFSGKCR